MDRKKRIFKCYCFHSFVWEFDKRKRNLTWVLLHETHFLIRPIWEEFERIEYFLINFYWNRHNIYVFFLNVYTHVFSKWHDGNVIIKWFNIISLHSSPNKVTFHSSIRFFLFSFSFLFYPFHFIRFLLNQKLKNKA